MSGANIQFIDTEKVKAQVKKICKENHFYYRDIAPTIGYQPQTLAAYMCGVHNSDFITLALIEKFHLKEEDIIKERFKCPE